MMACVKNQVTDGIGDMGICGENMLLDGLSLFAEQLQQPEPHAFPQFIRHLTFFSSAPLEDVVLAKVFIRNKTTACLGILFEYGNGAQRTVGECRLGSDEYTTFVQPQWLCMIPVFMRDPRNQQETPAYQVEFFTHSDHARAETYHKANHSCHAMSGILRLWFGSGHSFINIVPPS